MKHKRTILYINLDYPPMSGPAIWRALWFTKYLSEGGYKVLVLCGNRSVWCERYDMSLLKEIPSAVDVKRIKCLFVRDLLLILENIFNRPGGSLFFPIFRAIRWFLSRYYPEANFVWFIKAVLLGIYIGWVNKIDCIITSGPPHIAHIVGLFLKEVFRVRWIIDYRDLWTDDIPDQCPITGYQRKLFEKLERKAVRKADAVVTVSPTWLSHLREKYREGKGDDRFFLIRNGHNINDSFLGGAQANHVGNRLHIHCSGTPQPLSNTNSLFEALGKLRNTDAFGDNIAIVTFTEIYESQKNAIKSLGLDGCVREINVLPYSESVRYSLSSDVLMVIVNNDNPSRRGAIPAKTYEAMGLQRHILALVPTNSDVRPLLQEYGNATVCNVDDPGEICDGIQKLVSLYNKGQLYREADQKKTQIILDGYSRRSQARQLVSLIESLDS